MTPTKVSHEKKLIASEPKIEQRSELPYMGIRTQVPIKEMNKVIQPLLKEIYQWLGEHGISDPGTPLIRYHVINMTGVMDIELCVPIANSENIPVLDNHKIKLNALPAGRYASLVYIGTRNGIKGNKALLDWAAQQGLVWDRWDVEAGDAFKSRFEAWLTDPKEEPKQANWEIEVAIRLADNAQM